MYTDFFNLDRRPFAAAPAVENCVFLPSWNEMLNNCHSTIEEANGPVLVLSASGCGKSMFLEVLARKHCAKLSVVNLNCTSIASRLQLIQCILFELGIEAKTEDEGSCRLTLIDFLKSSETCPTGLLLLVDEANALDHEVLHELKMITNLVCGGSQHVRLVLAGNHALEELLEHPKLESLNQRIVLRCSLNPLSRDETFAYVLGNIQICGGNGHEIFQPTAIEKIHDVTDGVPRVISQLCHHALKLAFKKENLLIHADDVQAAWHDLQQLPSLGDVLVAHEADRGVLEFGTLDGEMLADLPDPGITEYGQNPDQTGDRDLDPSQLFGFSRASDERLEELMDQIEEVQEPEPVAPDASELFGDFDEEETIVEVASETITHTNFSAITLTTMDLDAASTDDPASSNFEHEDEFVDEIVTDDVVSDDATIEQNSVAIRFPVSTDSPTKEPAESTPPLPSSSNSKEYADDQDILNVNEQAGQPESEGTPADAAQDDSDSSDQAGQAVRMDYLDLFQQLKDIHPKSS